jgi:predicted SnoaL-like aldol condensation-catalyzing enzyme
MKKGKTNRGDVLQVEGLEPDRKQTALRFLELVGAGEVDDAYRLVAASDGKHHNPFFEAGFPALREGMKENALQFPNLRIHVKRVLGDGDLVAIHSHIVPGPGETGMAAVHLFRFQGNKIVEIWDINQLVPVDSPNPDGMF